MKQWNDILLSKEFAEREGKILITFCKLCALGDFFMLRPGLQLLRKRYPQKKIYFALIKKEHETLMRYMAGDLVDQWVFVEIVEGKRVIPESMYSERFDLYIDLSEGYKDSITDLSPRPINAKVRAGYVQTDRAGVRRLLKNKHFTHCIVLRKPANWDNFIANRHLSFFENLFGVKIPPLSLNFNFTPLASNPLLPLKIKKYILINLGSTQMVRRWHTDNFIFLIKKILDDGFDVVLIGGKDVIESADIIDSALGSQPHPGTVVNLVNKTQNEIVELFDIIKKCHLFIGHDSGLTHVAMGLGKPCLWLAPLGAFTRWTPWPTYYASAPARYAIGAYTVANIDVHYVYNQYKELLQELKNFAPTPPNDILSQLHEIVPLVDFADSESSLEKIRSELTRHSKHISTKFEEAHTAKMDILAVKFLYKKQAETAAALLLRALILEPDTLFLSRGHLLLTALEKTKDYNLTIAIATLIDAYSPRFNWHIPFLAHAYAGLDELETAISCLEKVIAEDELEIARQPGELLTYYYWKTKQYDKCLQATSRAIAVAPTSACSAKAWQRRAEVLYDMQLTTEALLCREKAIQSHLRLLSSGNAHFIAKTYLERENYIQCLAAANKTILFNPNIKWAWQILAKAYAALAKGNPVFSGLSHEAQKQVKRLSK